MNRIKIEDKKVTLMSVFATLYKEDGCIVYDFPYDKELVEKIKEFSVRSYVKSRKLWKVRLMTLKDIDHFYDYMDLLGKKSGGEDIDIRDNILEEVKKKREELQYRMDASFQMESDMEVPCPEGCEYRKFQIAGIDFMENIARGRVLISDLMGSGKTIHALGYLNVHPEFRPVIVVTTSTAKYGWQREINKWVLRKDSCHVVTSKNEVMENVDFIVINYDIIYKDRYLEPLKNMNFKCIIIDEVHYIKGYKNLRTKAVVELAKQDNIESIIALSGTPFKNRPVEGFNILNLLSPEVFSSWYPYAYRYCNAHQIWVPTKGGGRYVMDVRGASNTDELGQLMRSTVMLKRREEDLLEEMPAKTRTVIEIEVDSSELSDLQNEILLNMKKTVGLRRKVNKKKKKEIDEVYEEFSKSQSYTLELINQYRQRVVKDKIPFVKEYVESILEQDEKVVLFVYHREVFDEFMSIFGDKAVGIKGGMNEKEKQEAQDRFQGDDDIRVFVGSIRACSEAISLHASSNVVFAEYDWSPKTMEQAEDRVRRIVQKKSVVNSYWIAAKDTIDYFFINTILNKERIINSIENAEEINDKIDFFAEAISYLEGR